MATKVNGQRYYRTQEVCNKVGISKSTLLRWLRDGTVLVKVDLDRHGWRLFTQEDIGYLKVYINRVNFWLDIMSKGIPGD